MTMLHCPGVTTYDSPCDTVRSLCGKDATYQIEGSVYCYIHANQVMSDAEKKRHPDLAHCANPECLDPWYTPSRKPRKDQLNFCRTCGKSAMAERLRKRRQRWPSVYGKDGNAQRQSANGRRTQNTCPH